MGGASPGPSVANLMPGIASDERLRICEKCRKPVSRGNRGDGEIVAGCGQLVAAHAKGPLAFASGPFIKSGNNLLSRFQHYHRPWMLNGRVRNGNGCGHPGMVTGKKHEPSAISTQLSAERKERSFC